MTDANPKPNEPVSQLESLDVELAPQAPKSSELSQPGVGRLSLYYRELHGLQESGTHSVNSKDLGKLVNVSPAVVRRDLSVLGAIGRRGVGYDVQTLIDRIGALLGSGVTWRVVLIGVGSLGHALLRYRGFERFGFRLSAAFDNASNKVGRKIAGVTIAHVDQLETILASTKAELAILAVPGEQAALMADRLVACKIEGILNFAPITLKLAGNIAVVNVDLASELQRLAFAVHAKP